MFPDSMRRIVVRMSLRSFGMATPKGAAGTSRGSAGASGNGAADVVVGHGGTVVVVVVVVLLAPGKVVVVVVVVVAPGRVVVVVVGGAHPTGTSATSGGGAGVDVVVADGVTDGGPVVVVLGRVALGWVVVGFVVLGRVVDVGGSVVGVVDVEGGVEVVGAAVVVVAGSVGIVVGSLGGGSCPNTSPVPVTAHAIAETVTSVAVNERELRRARTGFGSSMAACRGSRKNMMMMGRYTHWHQCAQWCGEPCSNYRPRRPCS